MKTTIQLWALICAAFLTFSACDDDDNIQVSDSVSWALTDLYPGAKNVEWERKRDYYVAECRVNGKEMDVWFSERAEWLLSETDLGQNMTNLPQDVYVAFQSSDYATWRVDDLDMLEYPSQPTLYVIEVEQGRTEYQLFYTEEGTLTKTKDVTNGDDTHWPINQ